MEENVKDRESEEDDHEEYERKVFFILENKKLIMYHV